MTAYIESRLIGIERHGEAVPHAPTDAERPLTERGIARPAPLPGPGRTGCTSRVFPIRFRSYTVHTYAPEKRRTPLSTRWR